jgi:hypothetical protein
VTRFLASALVFLALQPAGPPIQPLPASLRAELTSARMWRPACPVTLSQLRLLTVRYWGFDKREHTGQLIVHDDAAAGLRRVFVRLHELRFPIRHMALSDSYGPRQDRPPDNDISGSFDCRQAVPSPCSGGSASGQWSNHAYGLAIDINPRENPYVGCGMTRDRTAISYLDRSRVRPGMVTPEVIAAFASIGWGWGGSWSGSTKDYMHFSFNGH